MRRLTRLLGLVLMSTLLMRCHQTNPTEPTALDHAALSSSPARNPFSPVAGTSTQTDRDAFAACLAGARAPACFSGGGSATQADQSTLSEFGRCLQGEGGERCLTGAAFSRGDNHAAVLPPAPTTLAASVNNQTVTLTWTLPPGEVVLYYVVEAGSAPGFANLASVSTGSTATAFSATGVPAGQYYVRVRAVNASGASGVSNEVVVNVGSTGCTLPEAPALRLVSNSGGFVALAWSVSVSNARTFIVQAGSAPGIADLADFDIGGPGLQFSTTGVPPGTYYVRVVGRNSCGIGRASNELLLTVAGSGVGSSLLVTVDTCECTYAFGANWTIKIDGAARASTGCSDYRFFNVSPGQHTVDFCSIHQSTGPFCNIETFTVAPGATYRYDLFFYFC